MAKFTHTFKVHRVEPRGFINGAATEERVLMHPIDPHEVADGVTSQELLQETRSGHAQIKFNVRAPEALGKFKEGQLVHVSFDIPE